MVACHLDASLAKRWITGKQIGNAEVRRVLGKHPLGEPQERTQELYNFFSKTTHPNRDHIAHRFLGEGNEFVLGASGRPSLALLADYGIKILNLWFWFVAFISFIYSDILDRADSDFHKTCHEVSETANPIAKWLAEQFDRVAAEEKAEMARTSSRMNRRDPNQA